MSDVRDGIRIPLSPARKMVLEIMHHAQKVPTLAHAKELNISPVVLARNAIDQAPSWMSIIIRAYGLLSKQHPELRQTLMRWPYTHLYEHPHSECAVLVEREVQGEMAVLVGKIRAPEDNTIAVINGHLRRFKEAPVLEIRNFQQMLRIGRMPGFLRRFVFWHTLYLSGQRRAKRFGTFAISSLGNMGVEQLTVLTPLTTYLTFGPVSANGAVRANIIYDHRVMDGRTVARCLVDLEKIMQKEILGELTTMRHKLAA
jgi:pyruvate/2-oxoglutarate dehydrogenase complex dihydrolipoamide acyltransferase (E2) component